jgi:hypothetical protein
MCLPQWNETTNSTPISPWVRQIYTTPDCLMKTAIILEEETTVFLLEYDNNLGQKNTMRLDAADYAEAVREAKSFLGIDDQNVDGDGMEWKFD